MKRKNNWASYLVLVVVLIIADQLMKLWVSRAIPRNGFREFLPGIMGLTNLRNDGAAWSLLEGKQWFFAIVSIAAIAVLVYLMHRFTGHQWIEVSLSLIFAGTIGNFIDRLRFGYVTDMFEFLPVNFPVFNIADMCLTVGVLILIIIVLLEKDDDEHDTKSANKARS